MLIQRHGRDIEGSYERSFEREVLEIKMARGYTRKKEV
jgi:hypothetical protein